MEEYVTITKPNAQPDPRAGFWLSGPNVPAAEIAAHLGYGFVVLDIEHGTFDLASLERFIPLLKGLGLEVISKVLGPERSPIQQALDFGSDGVIIPHVEDLAHARYLSQFAKFAPKGSRSFAGGRTTSYGGFSDAWIEAQNSGTTCFPLIEDIGALRDIEGILALDTVDGVFIGPSDLSLSRGRGAYSRTPEDFDDITHVAHAAKAAGKPWIISAWSAEEKELAVKLDTPKVLLVMEHGALVEGFSNGLAAIRALSLTL
ncbi:MAG: 4-hydroxy-2-oxovalerate aldolase [Dactylosporangium sp.]|jgi:4-hydroxy-2-oxoheptanedioate aldolase|nr:4-hydroxy-2-oxovalerate aldolase [Dactylosporangium sp.]